MLLLGEALMLSLVGGALGLALALWAVKALVAYGPENLPRLGEVRIDAPVALYALVLSLVSTLLFGSLPLLRRHSASASSLHERGRGNSDSAARMRTRNVLVGGQIALSLMLLVMSALMMRSFQQLRAVDPGFEQESVLVFDVALPANRYGSSETAAAFHERLVDNVRD